MNDDYLAPRTPEDNDPGTERDDAFAARIAEPLRARESLGASFEERLMTAVRAGNHPSRAAAERERGWWRRPRTLRLSPVGTLALAAAIAGLAFLGGLLASPRTAPSVEAAAAPSDTVHVVRFVLVAPAASSVAVVGDFNEWNRGATRLVPTGAAGVWTVSVPLSPGRHEYAFIVDGTRWVADPTAPITVHDDFGTTSSVVTVGSRAG